MHRLGCTWQLISAHTGDAKGLRGLRDAACRFADERAQGGVAPMHLAAAQGHLEAVRALLEKGASLAVQCKMVLVRAEQVAQDMWLLIVHEIMLPLLAPGGSGVTACWSFRTLRPGHLLTP